MNPPHVWQYSTEIGRCLYVGLAGHFRVLLRKKNFWLVWLINFFNQLWARLKTMCGISVPTCYLGFHATLPPLFVNFS